MMVDIQNQHSRLEGNSHEMVKGPGKSLLECFAGGYSDPDGLRKLQKRFKTADPRKSNQMVSAAIQNYSNKNGLDHMIRQGISSASNDEMNTLVDELRKILSFEEEPRCAMKVGILREAVIDWSEDTNPDIKDGLIVKCEKWEEDYQAYFAVRALCLVDPKTAFVHTGRESSPFEEAAERGATELVHVMLGELLASLEKAPMESEEPKVTVYKKYLSRPSGKGGMSAFHLAAQNVRLGVIKLLLQDFPGLADKESLSAVIRKTAPSQTKEDRETAFNAFKHIVELMEDKMWPIIWNEAIEVSSLELIRYLLRDTAPGKRGEFITVNSNGESPLHVAVSRGQIEIVKMLLEKGANPNAVDKHGNTPLVLAVCGGVIEIVELLLETGADLTAPNGDAAPILRAVLNKEKAIFMHLIQQDINLDETINIISRQLSYEDNTVFKEFLSSSSVSDANAHSHALSDVPTLVDASNSQKSPGETEQIHQIEADQVGSETTLINSEPIISNTIKPGIEDDDGTKTVYSVATQLDDDDNFVSTLAEDLFSYIYDLIHDTTISMGESENEQTWNQVLASLPGLLQDFALSLGHQASQQIARDVMVFTHKYRTQTTQKLRALYTSDIHSPPSEISVTLDRDEIGDRDSKIYSWLNGLPDATKLESSADETGEDTGISLYEFDLHLESNVDDEGLGTYDKSLDKFDESHESDVYDEDLGSDETKVRARVDVYRDYIHELDAYQWLRSRLHHNFLTTPAETDLFTEIRQKIMEQLPKPQIVSRRTSSDAHEVTFRVEWNPRSFLNQQGYLGEPGDAMANTLTLTGTTSDAQAMSCAEYLCKTWPLTGKVLLEVMKKIVRGEAATKYTAELFDHTKISAWTEASQIVLVAKGTKSSLAELGQQLAWLGSALSVEKEQTDEPAYSYCCLLLDRLEEHHNANGQVASHSVWSIRFETKRQYREAVLPNGECWTSLIRNHVLVQGYPILRRVERGTGLEVALSVISWLIQAPYATIFDGRPFIKGPRAMLVLAKKTDTALTWHLLESHNKSRITYIDSQIPIISSENIGEFDLKDLLKSRHFVGWCSESTSLVGTDKVKYNEIGTSNAPSNTNCPLGPNFIRPGVPISSRNAPPAPQNEKAINAPTQSLRGYMQRLVDLTEESVTLFDSVDNRSWLVDGVSALLHLVRESLPREGRDGLIFSYYKFEMVEYDNPGSRTSNNPSFSILMNDENLKQPLYDVPYQTDSETFHQRVDKIWSFLDQVIDKEKQLNKSRHSCHFLEGYEFQEVAAAKIKSISRRSIRLPQEGIDSIYLCRKLNVATLVGSGFGELIKPKPDKSRKLCSDWGMVPKGKGYICVQTSRLHHLVKDRIHGEDRMRSHIRNLLHGSELSFAQTCARREGETCHHAQTLQMSDQNDGLGDSDVNRASDDPTINLNGAVIFGRCSNSSVGVSETEVSNNGESLESDGGFDTAMVQGSSLATSVTSPQCATLSGPIERVTKGYLGSMPALDPTTSNEIASSHHEINQETDQLQNGSSQRSARRSNYESTSIDFAMYGTIVMVCFALGNFYWTTFSLSLMLLILLQNRWKPARSWVRIVKCLSVAVLLVWLIILSPLHVLLPTLLDLWTPYRATFDSAPYEIIYDRGNFSHGDVSVDVFAIHGLGSNASSAWVSRDGSNAHWLRDILPNHPDLMSIRVILLNHQTSWASHSPMMTFHDHARSMLHHISDVNKGENPIIFLAHSFGGLLLKQALLYAQSQGNDIALRTKGILFLGAPHYGASNMLIARLLACTAYWRGSSDALLKLLSTQKRDLQELDTAFRDSFAHPTRRYHAIGPYIANFLETRPEKFGAFSLKETVSREYGELGYAENIRLDTDHRGLNKFGSSKDPNYNTFHKHFLTAFRHETKGLSKDHRGSQ